jgi:hypothetical protein
MLSNGKSCRKTPFGVVTSRFRKVVSVSGNPRSQNQKDGTKNKNNMKRTQKERTLDFVRDLQTSVGIVESGRREIQYVFSDKELRELEDTHQSDLELLLGLEKAQILWTRLIQNCIRRWTGEKPSIWDVVEFSYYGDDLTASQAAIEHLQARQAKKNNIDKYSQSVLWLKRQMEEVV